MPGPKESCEATDVVEGVGVFVSSIPETEVGEVGTA